MNGGEIEFKSLEMDEVDVEVADRPHVYTPTCPANAPAVLTFSNITVTKKGSNKKKLLKDVSGSITGGLWAIMGSSGSGKTTLLSTIALRLNTGVMSVEGDIRLNGREYDAAVLKSMSAYVMQDDLLHAELTVAETLHWAALLRMPMEKTDEERATRIKEVIDLMGIDHCRDTIVGNTRRKGISGGERKRLCIAVELLNRPKLIFLDEPTSGVDSTTAYAVVKALKNLSVVGECTAVCTIHQPAPLTFALFDNLILMKQGEAVYQGTLADSHQFLKTLGKPCPASQITSSKPSLLWVLAKARASLSCPLIWALALRSSTSQMPKHELLGAPATAISIKEPLKTLQEEVLQREDEKCQKFVQELLSKYNYYF